MTTKKKKHGQEARAGYQPSRAGVICKDGKPLEGRDWRELQPPKGGSAVVPPNTVINGRPPQS